MSNSKDISLLGHVPVLKTETVTFFLVQYVSHDADIALGTCSLGKLDINYVFTVLTIVIDM